MLRKVRDLGTMPDGLMKANVDLVRGMIVARKLVSGEYKIVLPEGTDGSVRPFPGASEA